MAAVDLKSIDKRKAGIVLASLVAGLVAVILTNNYIEGNLQRRSEFLEKNMADKKEFQQLVQYVQGLEAQNQQLAVEMKRIASAPRAAPPIAEPPKPIQGNSLSMQTPSGKRAITVVIDKVSAVGGLINPGDKVDVIAHVNVPDPNNSASTQRITVTLFQNIQVLAIGIALNPPPAGVEDRPGSLPITFAFSPQEASLMTFAQQHGTLQLVLRSSAERQAYAIPPATWQTFSEYLSSTQGIDILGEPKEPVSVDAPKVIPYIQIFRGGQQNR